MTHLSNQVSLDALAAAFGFDNAEHAGSYVRGIMDARFAEIEFAAAAKLMLASALPEDSPEPVSYSMFLFVSDIQVEGPSVSFSYLMPVANEEKAAMAATDKMHAHLETIRTGEELLEAVFDPSGQPVPCNRVWVETSVVKMYVYGVQRYARNVATNVMRPVGAPFVPYQLSEKLSLTPETPPTADSSVVSFQPRNKR